MLVWEASDTQVRTLRIRFDTSVSRWRKGSSVSVQTWDAQFVRDVSLAASEST